MAGPTAMAQAVLEVQRALAQSSDKKSRTNAVPKDVESKRSHRTVPSPTIFKGD